jgi:type II secretory pathway pseudopilin PulG
MKTMKSIQFFALALAALTMASCSKDDVTSDLGGAGDAATLTINLQGEGGSTKAAGEAADADDMAINDFFVYVFRANGSLDAPIYTKPVSGDNVITATTAAHEVYVVANTAGLDVNTALAGVKNKAGLEAVSMTLMNAASDASNIVKTKVLMTGKSTDPIAFTETTTKTATVPVTLSFPLAKISLIVKDQRTNNEVSGDISIVDDNVVLLFAGKDHTLFGATPAVQSKFYTGDVSYGPTFITDVTESAVLKTAVNNPFTPNDGDTPVVSHHFYTFANDGTTQPTILAIQSTKTIKGTPATTEKVYYPIIFNAEDAKQTIVAGKNYTVTLTLTGDINGGEDGGTPDPEKPLVSANITVNISTTAWVVEPIGKEF